MNESVFVCCPRFCCHAIGRNVFLFLFLFSSFTLLQLLFVTFANALPRMVAHRDLPLFQVNCFTENLMKEVKEGDGWMDGWMVGDLHNFFKRVVSVNNFQVVLVSYSEG